MLIRNGCIAKVTKVVGVNFPGAWECHLPGQPVPETLDWDNRMGQVEPKPYNQNIQVSRSRPGWLSIKDFCGGEICGWGSHGLDQVPCALEMDESGPTEVRVEGQRPEVEAHLAGGHAGAAVQIQRPYGDDRVQFGDAPGGAPFGAVASVVRGKELALCQREDSNAGVRNTGMRNVQRMNAAV